MTVETRNRLDAPGRLTMRLAAGLLMDEGVTSHEVAKQRAEATRAGGGRRRNPNDMVRDAMHPLIEDGVVVRVGEDWYAQDLGDLAAWIADGTEAREVAGLLSSPMIPAPRRAA